MLYRAQAAPVTQGHMAPSATTGKLEKPGVPQPPGHLCPADGAGAVTRPGWHRWTDDKPGLSALKLLMGQGAWPSRAG